MAWIMMSGIRYIIAPALVVSGAVLADIIAGALRDAEPNESGERLLALAAPLIAVFVAAFMLHWWGSILVLPLLVVVTAQVWEELTCPDCAGFFYDADPWWAFARAALGTVPFIVVAALGTLVGSAMARETTN